MKVKVISEDFKSLAKGVLPFSGGYMATAGAVGLSFTETHVTIRAFAGTWAWGEVACHVEGYHENIHLVVSDKGLEVALLYCDGDNITFDVSSERLVAGSATINILASRTIEDLTPAIVDLSGVDHWNILPDQAKRVIGVSLTDTQSAHGSLTSLHLAPDVIFAIAKAGSHLSAFIPDWELNQTVIVPCNVALIISRKSDEIAFCVLNDIVVFAIGNLNIATPQEGVAGSRIPDEVSVECESSGLGTTSNKLIRELEVSALQADSPDIFLWTDGGTDLYYHSPGSELGTNSGMVWSDLGAFRICVDPVLMKRLIPVGDTWKMGIINYKEGGSPILCIVEENGVYHHLMSKAHRENHDKLFEEIIDKYSGGSDSDEIK